MDTSAKLWEAIATLRALLELVPDSPGGPCRLDTCVEWVRQKVEFETYTQPALEAPPSDPIAESCRTIDAFTEALVAEPPAETADGVPHQGPRFTGVPFPYELARSGPATEDASRATESDTLWHTERPWDAINETLSRLHRVLPGILAAVTLDRHLKDRISRDCQSEEGFLEPDMRGLIWEFLGYDRPVDERMRGRNNGRLDALAVLLTAVRTKPEVVLDAADAVIRRARTTLQGWTFDVPGGTVGHRGVVTPDLAPEVVFFLKTVVEASPEYVTFDEFRERAAGAGVAVTATKPDAIKRQLPKRLLGLLEFKGGRGMRLKPPPAALG